MSPTIFGNITYNLITITVGEGEIRRDSLCDSGDETGDREDTLDEKTPLYIVGRRFFWWEQRESNPRPSACKADALNQLSYAPFSCFFCPVAALDFVRRSVITER